MADITMARLQELTVILYAVGLVFYFIDYLNKDKVAHRSAFWIVMAVYVLQSAYIVLTIIETKRFPVLSLVEGIYFYVWLLIALSIILHLFYKVGHAVFFLNVLAFTFMTIHTFAYDQQHQSPIGEALISELLFIHITFAILSYAAFAMSFVFAILYLLVYKILKKKKWSKQFNRLPSLHQAIIGMKVSIYTGIPILLVSLILGVRWAWIALDDWTIFDMKILGSFFLIAVYGMVLYFNRSGRLTSNDFAWANIIAFLFVIVNFFLGSKLSQFHFWM
ncbi:cytochrome c biogenesis protein CcsA [Sporosarcina sp. 179-K 3D1 HS]|uniref:cytochrome c biogenesis protein CcsA n=1 Tax=Sporosarcina sp. 179-K 3D1 HS TaxID=3232169 RepID=UPI0039A08159